MKIAIIGGKLQGTEAVYLAREAGMESILIDRNPQAPAAGICDRFVCGDVVAREPQVMAAMKEADLVLPTNENWQLLQAIREIGEEEGLTVAFDFNAYAVTASKLQSDRLFRHNHIPSPLYYPQGKAPYIAKPSGESGSVGVTFLETDLQVEDFLANQSDSDQWIVQEYLEGPSYSLEVIGSEQHYRTYTVTQIHMDKVYDCCKVTAPCPQLTGEELERFAKIACSLAELIELRGIMDVEVIHQGGLLKVLEIDARLPSQTPIAVYHASGVNLLAELADIALWGRFQRKQENEGRWCAYEHYKLEEGRIIQEGEHMMSQARPLARSEGLFGSDVALSDYFPGCGEFKGIFVNWGEDEDGLEQKRQKLKADLKGQLL
ncbi:3-methylornithine--L-lysine ligase PylC [Aminipila butyrica]|uniref:3-methylornithine--L-lysine ligase PylC n=1 Tax=Aminipila butyrica TaxID=433296 RepID=A0A858BX54_9FIRM|nr:3-methylornithine--L-lysine ligase PylC [Aminipila butyrica]QIB69992.1 3-methylornithine--L-lysine ligase PylC [Aminipila butyrica]